MPRPVKFIAYLLVALFVLLLAAATALGLLFDPNDFKPQIAAQVKQASSLDLAMPGKIGWKVYPRLSLSVGETELHTEKKYAGDTLFAKLDSFRIGVGWRGLLSGSLRADYLKIDGLQLRLVTDTRGYSNWKDVEAAEPSAAAQSGEPEAGSELALELAELSLHDIDVRMLDQQLGTDQRFEIAQFAADYVNLAGKPFPVQLKALFSDGARDMALDMRASAVVNNSEEQYALRDMQGRFDQSNFTGEVKIGLGRKTTFDGQLAIDSLNIDDYLGETSDSQDQGETASSAEEFDFDALKSLNTRFSMTIGKLVAGGANIDTVSAETTIANSVLTLKNFNANVFGGNVQLAAKLDTKGQNATLDVDQKLAGVQIAELLRNREIAVNLSGKTSISNKLSMRGNSVDAWMRTVNGNTEFVFEEGRYGDDNVQYRVCQAIALARNEALGAALETGTQFDSVQASINWRNGVGTISNFTAGLESVKLNGEGSLSLVDKRFDLRVLANVTGDLSGNYPACTINEKYRDIKWPLRCRGDASNSRCGIDNSRLEKILAGAVKDRAVQELRTKATEKIEEKLGKGVGEALKGLFK